MSGQNGGYLRRRKEFMYLKLTTDNWDRLRFTIRDKQKDYDSIEKDKISIFIYGYPFNVSTGKWISSNDVYQLYLGKELNFIEYVEGVYAIIIFDKIKEECFIIIDRYGVYSLFYLRNNSYVILSDNINEIITLMPHIKLNQQSIIEYLNFGFKLGNKTHIGNIYEFESSKIYQINKKLEMKGKIYWKFLAKSKEDKIKKENFREIFNAHIKTAMNLEKKISLPLTGGLDTRTILSACIHKKQRLHCYTHGVKNVPDVKLARKICNHFGIKHSVYELNEEWIKNIPSKLEKNADIFNGLVPSLTFMHVKESYEKEDNKGELFLSGLLGNEIWRCLLGREVISSSNIDDVSLIITKRYTSINKRLIDIYKDYSGKEIMNLIKESVKNELLKDKNAKEPIAFSELFVFRNYCSNWASNSLKSTGKHFKIFAAFLQKDLLQYLPLLSLKEKERGFIQKYIITKNNSYIANLLLDVVDLRHGATVRKNLSARLKEYMTLLPRYFRSAINKISKKLFKLDIFRLPYFTDYASWLRNHHKNFLLEVLSYEKMVTKDFFKKEELEKIVNLFLNGDNSLAEFIVRLISLEIWLKRVSEI